MSLYQINDVTLEIPDTLLNDALTQKLRSGRYEFAEAYATRMRVKPRHRVLELGGGVGYISAICASIIDPANLVTIEANPNTLELIRHNLNLNGAAAAKLIHGAVVGDDFDEKSVLFRVGGLFWGASIADETSKPEQIVEVPALRFSQLMEEHRPNVVIIDIEGAEQHICRTRWPLHVRYVIMELHPRLYPTSVIKTIMDALSRSGLTYDPGASLGTLVTFRRV